MTSRAKTRGARSGGFVRVDKQTSTTITQLAHDLDVQKKEIVALAVERLRRERMLDALNNGYAELRADPTAWREELAESALWETSTISDGLTDE